MWKLMINQSELNAIVLFNDVFFFDICLFDEYDVLNMGDVILNTFLMIGMFV